MEALKTEDVKTEVQEVATEVQEETFEPTPLNELFGQPTAEAKVKPEAESKAEEKVKEVETQEPEVKNEEPEVKEEEVKIDPFETDDNPYKKKAMEFEKRYYEASKWGNQAHQKLKEMGYDNYQEEITEEQKLADLAFNEREKASHRIAKDLYGEQNVYDKLYADNAPFKQLLSDPNVMMRVRNADAPVMEALKVLDEHEFFSKYGTNIKEIPNKIKKEVEAELREKITKELQKKLSSKEQLPKTLAGVKSTDTKNNDVFEPTPFNKLFN